MSAVPIPPLTEGPQPWLQGALRPLLPALRAEVQARTTSTNQVLVDRLREAGRQAGGPPEPMLLVALEQTAGRGRLGRPWQSRPGASLMFSLALPLQRPDWSGLSLAVGLAAAEALDPAGGRIALKWPNDLWCLDAPGQGRKLGGVLIEGLAVGPQRWAVIGIGINILPLDDPALATPVAHLQALDPQASAASALHALLPALAARLARFEAEGFAGMVADYAGRDLLCGLAVNTTDTACPAGRAEGVDADGALRVQAADGRTLRIVSGEVSVRPAGMALPR